VAAGVANSGLWGNCVANIAGANGVVAVEVKWSEGAATTTAAGGIPGFVAASGNGISPLGERSEVGGAEGMEALVTMVGGAV
jgi:hypothetical protein